MPLGPIRVRVPSGRVLSLPFEHDFGSKDCEIRAGENGVCLDTILRFLDDGVVGEYFDREFRSEGGPSRSSGPVEVGYIYLSIQVGRRFAELSFQAATSSMSYLFLDSPSIRGELSGVLRDAGGLAGVIDTESDEFRVLSDPSKKIQIDRGAYIADDWEPEAGGSDYDVDGFASALLAKYDQALDS